MDNSSLMERVALTRLRRFERVAKVAETSGSPMWQTLARQAARNAYRDYLLAASLAGRDEAFLARLGRAA
jgi:hypothetical protein